MVRSAIAILVMWGASARAHADVTQAIKGAAVDWSEGTITAKGVGPADRHAPAPAVARDAALARAQAAASATLIAAAKALPGAHDLDDGAIAKVASQAVIVTEDVGTDGSVTVQLAIPIEAVRVAMVGPRTAAPAIEAVPAAVIVDATHVKVKPQLGVTIGGWSGPVLFVDKAPAEGDPRTGDHPAHRTATKAVAGAITIDGDPPAAGALAVVVITGKS